MKNKIYLMLWIFFLALQVAGCAARSNFDDIDPTNVVEVDNHLITRSPTVQKTVDATLPAQAINLSGNSYSILLIGIEEQPYTSLTESIKLSVEDAVKEEYSSGSLFGAEIKVHYARTKNNPKSIMKTFVDNVKKIDPLIVLMAAPVDFELASEINRLKVPVLYYGLGATTLENTGEEFDYLFWLTPFPDEQFAFYLDQAWKYWEELRPPGIMNEFKIGYFTWEELPNNLAVTPALIEFTQQNQFELVNEGRMRNSPNVSATNYLLQSITSGSTVQYTDTFSYGPMVMLNDIHSLGLNDFFAVGGSIWSYDENSIQYSLSPESMDTFYLPLPTKWWSEEDTPSIIQANHIWELSGRAEEEKNLAYLLSLGAIDIVVHVLEQTIIRSKGEEIPPKDIYSELINLDDYSVLDGLYEISYTKGVRSPKKLRLWAVSPDLGWFPIGEAELVPKLNGTGAN